MSEKLLVEIEGMIVLGVICSYGRLLPYLRNEGKTEEPSYGKRQDQGLPGGDVHLPLIRAFLLAEAFDEPPPQ